jgi:hypothetical protein
MIQLPSSSLDDRPLTWAEPESASVAGLGPMVLRGDC